MYTLIFIPTSTCGSFFQCICDDNIVCENMKDDLLVKLNVVLFDTGNLKYICTLVFFNQCFFCVFLYIILINNLCSCICIDRVLYELSFVICVMTLYYHLVLIVKQVDSRKNVFFVFLAS